MATYDYKCTECDEVFEFVRPMTDDVTKAIHKKCGSVCSQVILQAPGFEEAFAGSYRAENPKRASW
jgi:putative FmdB family regulatory protein